LNENVTALATRKSLVEFYEFLPQRLRCPLGARLLAPRDALARSAGRLQHARARERRDWHAWQDEAAQGCNTRVRARGEED
jgi:hypothetical protein